MERIISKSKFALVIGAFIASFFYGSSVFASNWTPIGPVPFNGEFDEIPDGAYDCSQSPTDISMPLVCDFYTENYNTWVAPYENQNCSPMTHWGVEFWAWGAEGPDDVYSSPVMDWTGETVQISFSLPDGNYEVRIMCGPENMVVGFNAYDIYAQFWEYTGYGDIGTWITVGAPAGNTGYLLTDNTFSGFTASVGVISAFIFADNWPVAVIVVGISLGLMLLTWSIELFRNKKK